jgi:hypothetical protein
MSEELKACPICKTSQYVYVIPFGGEADKLVCACNVCGASTGPCATEEESERQWNTLVGNRRAEPENKPLTLDELRQMSGEPVWVNCPPDSPNVPHCCIVSINSLSGDGCVISGFGVNHWFEHYEKYWTAYRRKPESEGA